MKQIREQAQVVVCGGGLAGFCAAVAAARRGAQTILVQDRPVFGGNSSSEVRVTPHGAAAYHAYARETGILSEALIEERARNHETIFENGWTNSVWDLVLYDMAMTTPNLAFHVNTPVIGVVMDGQRRIAAVVARTLNADIELTIAGDIFVDCTGDGVVADWAGCEWRMGTEARAEFDEPHATPEATNGTMGNSLHFKTRDMGRPVPFEPPTWIKQLDDPAFFYDQGRIPNKHPRGGYWWLEIGVPWDTVHDNETIRHELTRYLLGVWDWVKNRDPKSKALFANYALDWFGQVPGKRESRRIMGRYLMTEHDVQRCTVFPDEIAFGGWFVDLHTLGGLLAADSEPFSAHDYSPTTDYAVQTYVGPYGIPLRALIARDVDNLMMAGRNISATHAALGTVRVQGTTALMGQAAGTAAAVALGRGIPLPDVAERGITEVQQALLRDGCFLPNVRNSDPADLARQATATASSQALSRGVGPGSRGWTGGMGEWQDQPQGPGAGALARRCGQLIAIGGERVDAVSLCLSSLGDGPQTVEARLYAVQHIWDYRSEPGAGLASATLTVPAGGPHWVRWPVALDGAHGVPAEGYLRVDLLPNSMVQWHVAGALEPGQVAMFETGPGKMRRWGHGAGLSFRVEPPQACYVPANVLNGVTRPYRTTNLWRSDPAEPLPQWLELRWEAPQTIRQVELTFPGHLIREYHAYPPFYRDPQCAAEYGVQVWVDGGWREVVRVQGNYQRHRRHTLPAPVVGDRLRVVIYATNGDPAAALYEVRCY
jgi:hypothetical protein